MAEEQPQRVRTFGPPSARCAAVLAALAMLAGCQTTSPVNLWRVGTDDSLSKPPTKDELGDDRNLLARWLTPKAAPHSDPAKTTPLVKGPNGWEPPQVAPNPEADAEYQEAEKLFLKGELVEAETAFAKIAKKHKGTPWGEKAQFYLAETQFQRGKLLRAHDSFEKLVADYPGTIFLDKLINREYQIARVWLALDDPAVNPTRTTPWYGRFDGSRPLLDTVGYGRSALEHVRHHDPKGNLADDATVDLAESHLKARDFEAAANYFDELTAEYPKSPFLQHAQLGAIDSRIKGYNGPDYDVAGLEKARELIHQTMKTFPYQSETNEKLYHTLDLINDQMAERTYKVGDYYRRIGKVPSAEYYFGMLPQRWPKSPWTVKAKTQLVALAKMPRKKSVPSKIMTQPGSMDPFYSGINGINGMGGMGGMGMPG